MPASLTPEPRLPLEPEEYPLYRPPSRIGCSALSIVTLLVVAVFSLLFLEVTPRIVKGISSISLGAASGDATPQTVAEGALATQTAVSSGVITPTLALPSPTPRPCVKVTGTGGAGTALRAEPRAGAALVIKDKKGKGINVGEGATFQVAGPDVVSGKDGAGKDIVWMHVILPKDGRSGYALGKYLAPTSCP